jgi:hypothetical protein
VPLNPARWTDYQGRRGLPLCDDSVTLMDMVDGAADDRVGCVLCPVVETQGVGQWQEFHVLGEYAPAAGIIIDAAIAVRMNLTRIEYHGRITGDVLRLLLPGKAIGHTEVIARGQQLLGHLAGGVRRPKGLPTTRVILDNTTAERVTCAVPKLNSDRHGTGGNGVGLTLNRLAIAGHIPCEEL